jgi:hypothetical protein
MQIRSRTASNDFKRIKPTLLPKTEPYFFYPEPNGDTSSTRTWGTLNGFSRQGTP